MKQTLLKALVSLGVSAAVFTLLFTMASQGAQGATPERILAALRNTAFFSFVREAGSAEEAEHMIRAGEVLFFVEIPAGFERALRRGDKPQLLVAADATDPVGSANALASLAGP